MKYPLNAVSSVVDNLLRTGAWRAVKILTDKQIVRATRKLIRGKIDTRGNIEMNLTLGKPNFAERKFIKKCKEAREPFPIKKIQLQFPPKRKK